MIYLDWAATAPLCDGAKEKIFEYIDVFGNPSSVYDLGKKSKIIIEECRESIAENIGANPDELFFTSGSSESNSWALKNKNYLSSDFEHHSIRLSKETIPIKSNGIIDINFLKSSIEEYKAIDKFDTVTCMYVNNEIGTVQPVKDIAKISHDNNMEFHMDATQAMPHIHLNVKDINCDTMSFSGHKFGALKGIGALYVKDNHCIQNLIYGGKQEQGKRPGTENILGIISMRYALEETIKNLETRNKHIKILKDKMLKYLYNIKSCKVYNFANQLDSFINISFNDIPSNLFVTICNNYGIYLSSGSACNEGTNEISHVLKSIKMNDQEANRVIRISIGYKNTVEDIHKFCKTIDDITKVIERIRLN